MTEPGSRNGFSPYKTAIWSKCGFGLYVHPKNKVEPDLNPN